MKNTKFIVIGLFLAVLLTGCGETVVPQQNGTVSKQEMGAKVEISDSNKKDLCKLLSLEQVSKIVGVTFTSSEAKFLDERATVTDCIYSNDEGQSVSAIVNFDEEGNLAFDQYQSLKKMIVDAQETGVPLETFTGVGSEAFYSMTGFITQINAVNGAKNAWVTVAVTAPGGEEAGKNIAKVLANEIFKALE